MKKLVVLIAAVLVVVACSEGLPTQEDYPIAGPDGPQLLDSVPGKCWTKPMVNNTCNLSVALTPNSNYHCGLSCDIPQPDPISFKFSKPVYEVSIEATGHFYCLSQNLGEYRYYGSGHLVEVGHGTKYAEDSCNASDSSLGRVYYLPTYQGPIDSIVILIQIPDSVVVGPGPLGVADMESSYGFYLMDHDPHQAANCLTNIPLIDNQDMRNWLGSLWQDSVGMNGPKNSRREVPFGVFRDSVTGELKFIRTVSTPNETPCRGNPAGFAGPLPGPLVAIGHDHPMGTHRDTLPSNCFNDGRIHLWDDSTAAGVSPADWAVFGSQPSPPVPMIIVDSLHVHYVPPGANPNNADSSVQRRRRYNALNLCTVL